MSQSSSGSNEFVEDVTPIREPLESDISVLGIKRCREETPQKEKMQHPKISPEKKATRQLSLSSDGVNSDVEEEGSIDFIGENLGENEEIVDLTHEEDDVHKEDDIEFADDGCPVYCRASFTKQSAKDLLLMTRFRINDKKLCNKVPSGYSGKRCAYLVDVKSLSGNSVVGDLTIDKYGSWSHASSSQDYYRMCKDGTLEFIGRKVPTKKWDVKLVQNAYVHPATRLGSSQLKKKVFTVREFGKGTQLKPDSLALITYEWTGDPVEIKPKSHGNSKTSGSFQRTRPSVRAEMRSKFKESTPREAAAFATRKAGGILNVSSLADLPRDGRQAQNQAYYHGGAFRSSKAGKKASTDYNQVIKMLQENSFVKKFGFVDNNGVQCPIVFLATERMLEVFKKYCTYDVSQAAVWMAQKSGALYIDTTFDLGPCYVTVVATTHPEFEEKCSPKREPSVIVAFMLSSSIRKSEYKWLAEALVEKCGFSESIRIFAFITDDDEAEYGGLQAVSLFSEPSVHLLCGRHLKNNCKDYLKKLVPEEKVKEILDEIFGYDAPISKEAGRIRVGGLVDLRRCEFQAAVEKASLMWPEKFVQYFMRNKLLKIREKFLAEVREEAGVGLGFITTNRVEALNGSLKKYQRKFGGNLPMEKVIGCCKEVSEMQYEMLEKSAFDVGDYQTKNRLNRWEVVGKPFSDLHGDEGDAVKKDRLREFALDPFPFDNRVFTREEKEKKLSINLVQELEIPGLSATYPGEIQRMEIIASKILEDDQCVRMKRGKSSEFVVEDFSDDDKVFTVHRSGTGVFNCHYGNLKCLLFKTYNVCQHTVAVAEKIGELSDHVTYITDSFQALSAGQVESRNANSGNVGKKKSARRDGSRNTAAASNTTVQAVIHPPLMLAQPGLYPVPTVDQLQEVTKFKVFATSVNSPVWYNINPFWIQVGSPPKKRSETVLTAPFCGSCKSQLTVEGQPGFGSPADLYLTHEESWTYTDRQTGAVHKSVQMRHIVKHRIRNSPQKQNTGFIIETEF